MRKAISKALLRLAGWKIGATTGVETPKCVICVAPHTSNWDFIVGKLFYTAIGCNANFLIKKEWFFFPFNLLFNALGGVPIDRSQRTSDTEQMLARYNTQNRKHQTKTQNAPHRAHASARSIGKRDSTTSPWVPRYLSSWLILTTSKKR